MVGINVVSENLKNEKKSSIHCKEQQRNNKCHLILSKQSNTVPQIYFISITKSELPKK